LIPSPLLFSAAVKAAQLVSPVQAWLPESLKPMLALAPKKPVKLTTGLKQQVYGVEGKRRWRVALLAGCAQQVLDPGINEATLRLLNRHHCEVVVAPKSGCCGALKYHMGKEAPALEQDYAHMLGDEPGWADRAARVSALTRDITEFMDEIGLKESSKSFPALRVAYHSACSMQHGQKIKELPKRLLRQAGFEVVNIPEGHLCCGSAGTYNLFQADTAVQLRDRKAQRIAEVQPDLVAGGNIGCIVQLADALAVPIVHTVELLDWATGGPKPQALLTS
jgi:glycolate oxidase iron-sulfur subunit